MTPTNFIKQILLLACALALASCSDTGQESTKQETEKSNTSNRHLTQTPAPIPRLVENFQVGDEVLGEAEHVMDGRLGGLETETPGGLPGASSV